MKPILISCIAAVLILAAGCAASSPSTDVAIDAAQAVAAESTIVTEIAANNDTSRQAQEAQPVNTTAQALPTNNAPATDAEATNSESTQTAAELQVEDFVRTARTLTMTMVYEQPVIDSQPLGELKTDSVVVVTQAASGWYKIIFVDKGNRYGWISQDSVTFDALSRTSSVQAQAVVTPEETPDASEVSAAETDQDSQAVADNQIILTNNAEAATSSAAQSPEAIADVTTNSGLKGRLVFQTVSGGTIYVYDLASKTLRVLTGGFDPALSPDGTTVAFTRQGGEQGLYLIDINDCQEAGCVAGSNERLIYSGSESLRAPDWSPDGQYIVFSRVSGHTYCRQVGPRCVPDRPGLENYPLITMDQRGLSRVDYDGNNYRDIPALLSANSPDWTESGIVYQSEDGIQLTADTPEDTNRLALGGFEYRYQDPAWQPGGARIVLQSKEGSHTEIFSMNADGSGLVALTRPTNAMADELPQNVSPAWSPDGRSIVFLSNRDENGSAGKWQLWVMDADGSNQRLLDPDVLGQINFRYDNNADQMVDWGVQPALP
ncbi:MAG: PD40 domain-containing protein [Anaerolineae bacterium]|nr:PD40 domain-containing protein [Anaerolineae bacterium]